MSRVDNWFESLEERITSSIQVFASAIFLLFTLGMVFGVYFYFYSSNPFVLFIPPALGIIAYYRRDVALFAAILFVLALFL